MAVLAELSQFTWSGVRPDDAWERPRIQVENNARGRTRSKILCKRVVSSLCTAAPPLQKILLSDFLEGRGGCTQASR